MADIGIKIDFGSPDLREKLLGPVRNPEQLTAALKNIGEELLDTTIERFAREIDPKGKPWQPLKSTTLKQKKRKRKPNILQELGARGGLKGSINYHVDGLTLRLGSNKPYARIHQLGGKAGRNLSVIMPARPYLGLSSDDEEAVREILLDHLEEAFD